MTRLPSHAGPLRPLERCIFTLVFCLMGSFVVLAGLLASTTRGHVLLSGPLLAERTVASGLSAPKAGQGQLPQRTGSGHADGIGPEELSAGPDVQLNDAELATALQPVVGTDRGHLAAGVMDLTTGASATYNSAAPIRGGGLVTADLLAALLLQHQQAGTPVSAREAELAADMMANSNGPATAQVWAIIGGAPGLAAANAALKLRDTTTLALDPRWKWTATTVADQLQLLADFTGPKSPLNTAAQDYALGLMAQSVTAPQPWSVRSAASAGAPGAVTDGSLVGPRWVIGSIGVIWRNGHELLVAVLSDHNPAQGPAVAAARGAALAAAGLIN